jgi:hypothetical protein
MTFSHAFRSEKILSDYVTPTPMIVGPAVYGRFNLSDSGKPWLAD